MRMAISTLNKAKDGSARRSAVRRPFEELHAKVTTAARHHEAQENMRQHEVAEPEERRAHLRVIALEKIMSELESIENGLGHALAGLGGLHCSQELPRPRPQHRQQRRRIHLQRRRHREVKALGALRSGVRRRRKELAMVFDRPTAAKDLGERLTARCKRLRRDQGGPTCRPPTMKYQSRTNPPQPPAR